jgi:Uma2 family endonuclease
MVSDINARDNEILREPPPLLVVEVSSPSTHSDDWGVKLTDYARSGAGWYWVIDLVDREVVVLENTTDVFAERARFRTCSTVPGPFVLDLDPGAFPKP